MPKISLDLELNTKPVEQGIKEAEGYIRDSKKRLKSDAGVEFTMNLAKLRLDLEKVNRELKQAIKDGEPSRIIKLKVDQEALKKEITIANRSLNNFINTGNENYSALSRLFDGVSKTGGKLTGILAGVSPAAGAVVSSFGGMSAAAGTTGAAFGITGAAVGGMAIGLKKASDIARSFEDAFTGVSKTVDGTPEQLSALRQELIQMSKEIPVTFEELSSIAAIGGSLGVPIEQMGKFTNTVAKLGVAVDGISAEEAATMLAKIGTVTGEGVGKIDKMGSAVVALGNNMAATEGQILDFTNRISGTSQILGVGSTELFALSATMTSLGLSTESGSTAISTAVTKIAVAVASSSAGLKDIAKVSGMTTDDFKKQWGEDAFGAFMKFNEGLAKSGNGIKNIVDIVGTGKGEIETLQKLGSENGLAMLADALKTARHEMNLAKGDISALDTEANKRFDTLSSQATIMSNKWRAAFEPTGTMLNDTILKPLMKVIGDSSSSFQFWVGMIIIGFNTLRVNFSVGMQYLGNAVKSWWDYIVDYTKYLYDAMSGSIQAIGILFSTLGKVIGLKVDSIGNIFKQLAENTKTIFSNLADNIGIAFGNIGPLIGEGMNEVIKSIAKGVNQAIKLVNDFTGLLKNVPLIGEKMANFTKMGTVGASGVDFGTVKSFKSMPDLLKIDGGKAGEIEKTWSDMYGKIASISVTKKPQRVAIDDLMDYEGINKSYEGLDASVKKFADSQVLAKARVANAEDAEKAKIKKKIQDEIDTGKKDPKGGSGNATKAREDELRKIAKMEIDAVKKSADSEKDKSTKILAIKEKLDSDINALQGKQLENDVDASKKTLEEIKKAEDLKRDTYKKTSNANDDAHQRAVDKLVDHQEAIIKLGEEYKKMADAAGKSLRDLGNELKELTDEKTKNQEETFKDFAQKRVDLLKEQKDLEKDIAAAIKEGGDQKAWDKIAEDQQKLVGIKSEILAIEKATPKSTLDEVARVESLNFVEKGLLDLKEKQLEVDKKIETNRQKRMVDESILNGGKILISGQGENAKAQIKDAQGIVTDLTDFAAQEYAIDTANRQAEIDNKVAIEQAGIDEQLLALQNLDVERRAIDVSYSEFFKSELQGRIDKTRELIRVLQEAASLAGGAGVSSQQNAILKDATKNATRTVSITNNINNGVDVESVNRANTKGL